MVVDTGVGKNCVLYEAITMEARLKIHNGENYHFGAANGEMIPTVGELQLIIRVRDYLALARFVVCKTLPFHILDGTEFQDAHFQITNHKEKFLNYRPINDDPSSVMEKILLKNQTRKQLVV